MPDLPDATADDLNPRFARKLRRARESAGLTQEELAARAGLSAKAIGALERGERRHPYPSTIRALAAALNLSEHEHQVLIASVSPLDGVNEVGPTTPLQGLPAPRTSLVGRAGDIALGRRLLLDDAVPLLTLTGTGGVGKTRRALAIAHDVAAEFPDGVVFVDLAPQRHANLVLAAIAQALNVRQAIDRSLVDVLAAFFQSRRFLLILDNLEHLLPAAVQIIDLLERAPSLQILATSRAPLRVRGEHLQLVLPLALPGPESSLDPSLLRQVEAVALFVARARAAVPDFVLGEQNAVEVAELCRRLDGLPLAIELAAARLRLLPIDQLLTLLSVRLRVLTDGERDRPPRHHTLRDAIAWSYDLLAPDEQALFRRLSVFVGGVTLDTLDWIASGAGTRLPAIPDATDRLAALMDHGLVKQQAGSDGNLRFGMLETVGEFALEQLGEHGETAVAQEVLTTWGQDVAKREELGHLLEPDLVRRCRTLTAEHANLLAALDHLTGGDAAAELLLAARLGPFWAIQGHHTIGRSRLERAVERIDGVPDRVASYALAQLGLVALYQADLQAADTALTRAAAHDLRDGGRYRHVIFHMQSSLAMFGGDPAAVITLAAESVALSDAAGDDGLAAHARLIQARLAIETRDFEAAESLCRQVLAAFPAAPYSQGCARLVFGWVATGRGEHALALQEYVAALSSYLPVGDPLNIQPMLDGAAITLAFLGRAEPAARLLAAAERQRHRSVFMPRPPRETANWDLGCMQARSLLGPDRFAAAWREGSDLSLEAAVAEAVAETHLVLG